MMSRHGKARLDVHLHEVDKKLDLVAGDLEEMTRRFLETDRLLREVENRYRFYRWLTDTIAWALATGLSFLLRNDVSPVLGLVFAGLGMFMLFAVIGRIVAGRWASREIARIKERMKR